MSNLENNTQEAQNAFRGGHQETQPPKGSTGFGKIKSDVDVYRKAKTKVLPYMIISMLISLVLGMFSSGPEVEATVTALGNNAIEVFASSSSLNSNMPSDGAVIAGASLALVGVIIAILSPILITIFTYVITQKRLTKAIDRGTGKAVETLQNIKAKGPKKDSSTFMLWCWVFLVKFGVEILISMMTIVLVLVTFGLGILFIPIISFVAAVRLATWSTLYVAYNE